MQIDQNVALLSDRAVQAAFLVYLLALVASLFYYVRVQSVLKLRDARTAAEAENALTAAPALAGAAGSGSSSAAAGGSGGSVPVSEEFSDTVAAEDYDPERLKRAESLAGKLSGVTQALVWLGIILHLVGFAARGFSASRFPLGNLYEYVLGISLCAMIIAAGVLQRRENRVAWPWVLTPVLLLLFYGSTVLYAESAPVVPALQSYWLPIHVTVVSIGGSIALISGVFSALSLLRDRDVAWIQKVMRPLPNGRRLDEYAYRLAVFTLPVFGLGIIFGAIWAESAWGRPWGWDPKETVSFITWILYAAYLHARATAGWRRSAAWINLLALATNIFNLFFINQVVSGLHSYAGLN